MRMLVFPAVDDERLAKIQAVAGPMDVVNAATADEALAAIPAADAFFGKLTPQLLAAAGRLRWVQCPTASLEHYVFPELVEHPCTLTNMRGIYSDVIADFVLGLMLALARNLHIYIRQQAERRWEPVGGEQQRTNYITGPGVQSDIDRAHRHLGDATLGIVGFGGIGREVGRRAAAFGMRIIAVDADPQPAPDGISAVWGIDALPALLAESDFVVVAAPHTPETEKMFRAEQFQQMRATAFLVNIGRGAIVDLAALTAALASGEIAGAALDVCEIEPLPPDHPLWEQPNLIITPHVAACTPPIAGRHLELLLDNIRRFVVGQPLRNVADKRLWY